MNENIIKVVIFNNYGMFGYPEHIQKQITEKDFPANRCGSIIGVLEKYEKVIDYKELEEKHRSLKKDEVLRYGNKFYFGNTPYNTSCMIVEVDKSKKWTIEEYDGAESINYLEPTCICEKLNYWQ